MHIECLCTPNFHFIAVFFIRLFHSEKGIIPNVPVNILGQVENILNQVKAVCPQFELDGEKNVWIVKPGAKSRGRGRWVGNVQLV